MAGGRIRLRHPFHFEQDLAGPDHRHPVVRRSLALSHTGFGRLLGDRLSGNRRIRILPPRLMKRVMATRPLRSGDR